MKDRSRDEKISTLEEQVRELQRAAGINIDPFDFDLSSDDDEDYSGRDIIDLVSIPDLEGQDFE